MRKDIKGNILLYQVGLTDQEVVLFESSLINLKPDLDSKIDN